MPADASTLLLAGASGIAFSMMALAYRWGETKHIRAQMVFWGVAAIGSGVFAVRCTWRGEFQSLPWPVIIWAIVGALGQYVAIRVMTAAMSKGAFGPIWCALTLNFIPVTVYALTCTSEHQSAGQWLSMVLAIACVVVAAMDPGKNQPDPNQQKPAPKEKSSTPTYGLMLLTLMLTSGLLNVGMKDLASHHFAGPHLPNYSDAFLFLMYLTLFTAITLEWLIARKPIPHLRVAAGPVLLAGVGSLIAMTCLIIAGLAPNVIVFVVTSILSVLGGFLGSRFFFKDPLTRTSWFVIALGVASVGCTVF